MAKNTGRLVNTTISKGKDRALPGAGRRGAGIEDDCNLNVRIRLEWLEEFIWLDIAVAERDFAERITVCENDDNDPVIWGFD